MELSLFVSRPEMLVLVLISLNEEANEKTMRTLSCRSRNGHL